MFGIARAGSRKHFPGSLQREGGCEQWQNLGFPGGGETGGCNHGTGKMCEHQEEQTKWTHVFVVAIDSARWSLLDWHASFRCPFFFFLIHFDITPDI